MLREVLDYLAIKAGGLYVDGTFGAGGYCDAILNHAPDVRVVAIDCDPDAEKRAAVFAQKYGARFRFIKGRFGAVAEHMQAQGLMGQVDGFVLDLGVSSFQLDEAERGFSFRFDGPLDMRMKKEGESAADFINSADEGKIADVIYHLGEERYARPVAKAIVQKRKEQRIETTFALKAVVHSVIYPRPDDRIDPATRTFQALRIYINDELHELEAALEASPKILKTDGRLVVVSFHSLEDMRVKSFLRSKANAAPKPSRFVPVAFEETAGEAIFAVPEKSGIKAQDDEIALNPRARSARLRYAIRTGVPHKETVGRLG
jgi:16S rRNA (cytosine1402-N4)-methyltransferase